MTAPTDDQLRARLRKLGLSANALTAAWPAWWSSDANASASARAELAFTVARRLGIDPRSLLEVAEEPRFIWRVEARFKRMSDESELEREGITSFAHSVAAALLDGMRDEPRRDLVQHPNALRDELLRTTPYIGLPDVLGYVWTAGVPVIHLRVFPWEQKRIAAMTVRLGDRWAIMTGRDAIDPASLAYYIAHELGHVALGQIAQGSAVVDLDDGPPTGDANDAEDRAADEFAIRLLTGESDLHVFADQGGRVSGAELARVARNSAPDLRIDPGLIALIYGRSTGHWDTTTKALKRLYPMKEPAWAGINELALAELDLAALSADRADFLRAVMGG